MPVPELLLLFLLTAFKKFIVGEFERVVPVGTHFDLSVGDVESDHAVKDPDGRLAVHLRPPVNRLLVKIEHLKEARKRVHGSHCSQRTEVQVEEIQRVVDKMG